MGQLRKQQYQQQQQQPLRRKKWRQRADERAECDGFRIPPAAAVLSNYPISPSLI
jgi:hypothetical protein